MAYDEYLAQRIRDLIGDDVGIDGKKMFGGLAILLDGSMAVGVSGEELMVRVGVDDFDEHWLMKASVPLTCPASG